MTSNLVVAGSSPAGGTGQGNFDEQLGPYGIPYAENGGKMRTLRTVDATHLIALAESWERCADNNAAEGRRAAENGDHVAMSIHVAEVGMYRRHATQLREIVNATTKGATP